MEKHHSKTDNRPDNLLSPEQVANMLSVSAFTIRRWIRNEQLEAIRIGPKLIRIPGHAVHALLEGLENGTAKRGNAL